jgi:general secretion pathway protein F
MSINIRVQSFDGTSHWLSVNADTLEQALAQVRRNGLQVLAVGGAPDVPGDTAAVKGWQIWPRRLGRFPLLLFTQELLALLDAGLNVVEAIETLCRKEREPLASQVINQLFEQLKRGVSLSDALSAQPRVFPMIYVAGVRASERTGGVEQALRRYVAYQTQLDELRGKILAACVYPALLAIVGLGVTLFLLGFVVPRFSRVIESAGREVSGPSLVLLSFGNWVGTHPEWLALMVLSLAAGAVYLFTHRPAQLALSRGLVRVPLVRGVAHSYALARFYRTVSVLLESGTPLAAALNMTASTLPPALAQQAQRAEQGICNGLPLSEAMQATTLLTPISDSLIRAGERSGRLAEMLERSAGFLDQQLTRSIETIAKLFEPVLMLLIGGVIGTVVVLMYLPIFELARGFR